MSTKWKWSGELYTQNEDKASRICNVMLTDATEPRPRGLRINLCLTSSDSIRFKKLHDVSDLSILLQASEAVQKRPEQGPQSIRAMESNFESPKIQFTPSRLDIQVGRPMPIMMIIHIINWRASIHRHQ